MPSHKPNFMSIPIVFVGLLAACISCSDAPTSPSGRLEVVVTSDVPNGASGKRIEIVRFGQTEQIIEFTDEEGRVEFVLDVGRYILIAAGIRGPGPGTPYDWREVQVRSGVTTTVEFVDCAICE
jgi:hypothetical protein